VERGAGRGSDLSVWALYSDRGGARWAGARLTAGSAVAGSRLTAGSAVAGSRLTFGSRFTAGSRLTAGSAVTGSRRRGSAVAGSRLAPPRGRPRLANTSTASKKRSEEHTSELQSRGKLV